MKHLSTLIIIVALCAGVANQPSFATEPATNSEHSVASSATNDPGTLWRRDYGPSHEERMQWWREARFGMFIHWGVYSVPAGVYKGEQSKHIGEWLMRDYNIPVS